LGALESDCLREPQPRFDATGVLAMAIVVEDALHPVAAHGAVVAVGKNGSVLQRDVDLIVEAVRHPTADLLRRRLARVEHDVEGMMDVISPTALAQPLLELFPLPGGRRHSSTSRPSTATSMPRRASSARCGESSSRIGLVLFTWIRILRVSAGSPSSHSSMPPGPLCGRCPISRARLADSPSACISSSLQNVPSTMMHAACCIARHTASSIAPSPGA